MGVDKIPHEVAILRADGTIVLVNEAWRQFADDNEGAHPTYWIGENYFDAHPGSEDGSRQEEVTDGLRAVIDGDMSHYQHEYPCHSPDEQRWFRMDAVRFHQDDQLYLLVVHTNITDRMLAELRSEARAEQLETVLAVLQHDLRNPLNVIEGYTELLAAQLDDTEAVDSIRQAAVRISDISESTLSFSKAGTLAEVEPVSIDELAETAWQTVQTEDATLAIEESQRLFGDRRLLLQLFENLFRNAVEHAGRACHIRVGGCSGGFFVEDDGPGIPQSLRTKVLQADYSTQGTGGLGLAIVQAVVRAHSGTLKITTGTDGGTRFEISSLQTLPDASDQ
ncbi:ATP-binding protein [Halobium palmae]|uniref:histidine kinase n=1 Tax=Halobium palmae TaxID=1776492 RepID=A0ABD5RX23_9EURY